MSHSDSTIHDVSDTALWVAHYRALETERPDALFRDPYAKLLAGERGKRIAESMGQTSTYTAWTVVIRTVIIDRFIEEAIRGGVELVLNLGAGLDSRPYRMQLPESLQWVEVDHPAIVEHKEKILASEKPRCRLERVRLDLADRAARGALFADVGRRARKVLVLTEGVLPYLSEAQVSELAEDLRWQESFQFWIGEYFDKSVYRYINTRGRIKRMRNAPFLFFPDDWLGFFERRGWVRSEIRYTGEETLRLEREIPKPWYAFLFMLFASKESYVKFQRMTGFVLFGRKAAT